MINIYLIHILDDWAIYIREIYIREIILQQDFLCLVPSDNKKHSLKNIYCL